MQNITISAEGWQTVGEYTVPGGLVLLVRSVYAQIIGTPTTTDTIGINEPWRLMVDQSPVLGCDDILINPLNSLASFGCYVLVPSNRTIKVQKYVSWVGETGAGANWHVRMTGQLLQSQNVTLPWEPCNVE